MAQPAMLEAMEQRSQPVASDTKLFHHYGFTAVTAGGPHLVKTRPPLQRSDVLRSEDGPDSLCDNHCAVVELPTRNRQPHARISAY
jgi:hypothetical protein